LAWVQEECQRLQEAYNDEVSGDFSRYYQYFKSAWQLDLQQLAALKLLAEWRERRARQRDRPRNWILKDAALFAIAQGMVTSRAQLAVIPELGDSFIRHEGDQVLQLVKQASGFSEADCPPLLPKPFTQGQKNRLRKARDLIEAKATELSVSPEFLCRRKALHALLMAIETANPAEELNIPKEFLGWREPIILNELIGVLRA